MARVVPGIIRGRVGRGFGSFASQLAAGSFEDGGGLDGEEAGQRLTIGALALLARNAGQTGVADDVLQLTVRAGVPRVGRAEKAPSKTRLPG